MPRRKNRRPKRFEPELDIFSTRTSYFYPTPEWYESKQSEEEDAKLDSSPLKQLLNSLPFGPYDYRVPRLLMHQSFSQVEVEELRRTVWNVDEVKVGPFTFEVVVYTLRCVWSIGGLDAQIPLCRFRELVTKHGEIVVIRLNRDVLFNSYPRLYQAQIPRA